MRATIEAGKAIFCEWPLGNSLEEAEQLSKEAASAGLHNFIGLQARSNPGIHYVRQLVRDGYVGEVLSTSIVGSGGGWGGEVAPADAYTMDQTKGASLLTIPFGHTIDSVCYCLGEAEYVVAELATRRPSATEEGTGRALPVTVADQIVVGARLKSGATLSAHLLFQSQFLRQPPSQQLRGSRTAKGQKPQNNLMREFSLTYLKSRA